MLVLSRRLNEKILLPSIHTSVEVLDIKGDRVRLGIEAPASVMILREELAARQAAEGVASAVPAQKTVEAAAQKIWKPPRRLFAGSDINSAIISIRPRSAWPSSSGNCRQACWPRPKQRCRKSARASIR